MAFNEKKLTKVAEFLFRYDGGDDNLTAIKASGYFNEATLMLKKNDIIIAIGDGGTGGVLAVSSADNADTVTTVSLAE